MKTRKVLKETTNSRVYNLVRRRIVVTKQGNSFICPPNKGCNSRWEPSTSKNWKLYRKEQTGNN